MSTVLLLLMFFVAAHPVRAAAEKGSSRIKVSGEILDMACYLAHGGKGPSHRKCAQRCAAEGQPIGLLADDGVVYLLMADHADLDPYGKAKKLAGSHVEISAEIVKRDGFTALTVYGVSKK